MAITTNFAVYRAEDKRFRFEIRPVPDGGINTMSFLFTLRTGPLVTDTLVLQKVMVHEDEDDGVIYVDLSDTELNLTPAVYYYDVWRTTDPQNIGAIGQIVVMASRRT